MTENNIQATPILQPSSYGSFQSNGRNDQQTYEESKLDQNQSEYGLNNPETGGRQIAENPNNMRDLNNKDETKSLTIEDDDEDYNEDGESRSAKSRSNLGISRNSKNIKKGKDSNGFIAQDSTDLLNRQIANANGASFNTSLNRACQNCGSVECQCQQLLLQSKKRQSHYFKIDDDMRRTIVFEVMVMKESLKNVCDRYGINFSSAKNVIQIYRKEGRLEKKIVKSRKQGASKGKGDSADDYSDQDDEEEEGVEYEEDGTKIVTLAPEEQRCKLNLFVYPLEDQEDNKNLQGYFQMNLQQLLEASPELNLDFKTQLQLQTQKGVDSFVKIPKNEKFQLQPAAFGYSANLNGEEQRILIQMHDLCQQELSKYHHLYKKQNSSMSAGQKV